MMPNVCWNRLGDGSMIFVAEKFFGVIDSWTKTRSQNKIEESWTVGRVWLGPAGGFVAEDFLLLLFSNLPFTIISILFHGSRFPKDLSNSLDLLIYATTNYRCCQMITKFRCQTHSVEKGNSSNEPFETETMSRPFKKIVKSTLFGIYKPSKNFGFFAFVQPKPLILIGFLLPFRLA